MTLVSDLATRALADDFDTGRQLEAERYVKEGIQHIFRTTTLARGGLLAVVTIAQGASQLSGLSGLTGVRITGIIHQDNGDEIDETDDLTLESMLLQNPARGRPIAYAFTGNVSPTVESQQVLTYPTADKAYVLLARVDREPGAGTLASGGTVPLPDAYEALAEYFARQELYAREGDVEMANYWQGRFEAGRRELRGDLQRMSGKNRRVPGTWSSGNGTIASAPQFHYKGLF